MCLSGTCWDTFHFRVHISLLLYHHFYDYEMLKNSSIVFFTSNAETNCIGELMALFFWHTTSTSLQLLTSPGNPFQLLFQNSMDSGLLDIDNAEAYSVKSGGKDLADFDRLIQFSWQQKMDEGAFRYPFQHPQCKKLLGNYNYLAQYNSFRVIDHLD